MLREMVDMLTATPTALFFLLQIALEEVIYVPDVTGAGA